MQNSLTNFLSLNDFIPFLTTTLHLDTNSINDLTDDMFDHLVKLYSPYQNVRIIKNQSIDFNQLYPSFYSNLMINSRYI